MALKVPPPQESHILLPLTSQGAALTDITWGKCRLDFFVWPSIVLVIMSSLGFRVIKVQSLGLRVEGPAGCSDMFT